MGSKKADLFELLNNPEIPQDIKEVFGVYYLSEEKTEFLLKYIKEKPLYEDLGLNI